MTMNSEELLSAAFLVGANATLQAFGFEPTLANGMKIMEVIRKVAEGEATLTATPAELRLRGVEMPEQVGTTINRRDRELAAVILRQFRKWNPPNGGQLDEGGKS
jgi:hypothetical protein